MCKESEWAWQKKYAEFAHGPFDSREAAFEDIQEVANDEEWEDQKIELGKAEWPDPGEYITVNAMDSIEMAGLADEAAYDDGWWTGDEELFEFVDYNKAQEELLSILQSWARKNLYPCKWTFKMTEEITISKRQIL